MQSKFGKPRILITDDNVVIRNQIKSFYAAYDFDLLEASDGQQAVEAARASSPDLILMDIQMPVLNGYEATALLKSDTALKDIPILVITSQEPAELTRNINGMYDGYMQKPVRKPELIEATMKFLYS